MESMMTEFEMDVFDEGLFFRSYWRTKPVYIRGGARYLFRDSWTMTDFDNALKAAKQAGNRVDMRSDEVIFLERASQFDERLDRHVADLAAMFGAPEVWFDAVSTSGSNGIGSHFDHSDNFVLQQVGTKQWTLASRSRVPVRVQADRMLQKPGVGSFEMPEVGTLEFTVSPGDLLYIPLLWPHSGVSTGDSLSISLVCPAVSLHAAVMPLLFRAAGASTMGGRAIPALHAQLSTADRAAAEANIRSATKRFVELLADDEILHAVHKLLESHLGGRR